MSLNEKIDYSKDNTMRGFKHGLRYTYEYDVWIHMKMRCLNEKDKSYSNYGGRGITFCNEWNDVNIFISDMGLRPSKSHSLDRINNDGNYCKENCRWVTRDIQNKNKRNNVYYELNGEFKIMRDWSKKLNIPYHILRYNLYDKKLSLTEFLKNYKNVTLL